MPTLPCCTFTFITWSFLTFTFLSSCCPPSLFLYSSGPLLLSLFYSFLVLFHFPNTRVVYLYQVLQFLFHIKSIFTWSSPTFIFFILTSSFLLSLSLPSPISLSHFVNLYLVQLGTNLLDLVGVAWDFVESKAQKNAEAQFSILTWNSVESVSLQVFLH